MSRDPESVYSALSSVAARYAAGVDRRDRALFLSAFADDAAMLIPSPSGDGTLVELRGHEEIGDVVQLIARYSRTFHFVGQARYDFGDTESTGEVYCIAYHMTPDQAANVVMYIRYQDIYRRAGAGPWLIGRRQVQIDWTETRPLDWSKETQC